MGGRGLGLNQKPAASQFCLLVLFRRISVQVEGTCVVRITKQPAYYSGASTASSLVYLIDRWEGGPFPQKARRISCKARALAPVAGKADLEELLPSKWPFHGCEDESEPLPWDSVGTVL